MAQSRPGRVYFLNRFFHPDISATSQMTSDLAFALAGQGYVVSAICSRLRYDDPDARLARTESLAGVDIHRVASTRFGRRRLAGRAVDFLSFYMSSLYALLRLVRRGDVVVAETDPPLISLIAALGCWLRGAQLVNWLQDVFPEVASELGSNPLPGWLNRAVRRLRNATLRRAHCNVVLGARMRERVSREDVPAERIRVIENWADGVALAPFKARDAMLRRKLDLAGRFVVGYSGNLGRAHEYQTLLDAAQTLCQDTSVVFLMTGGGAGMQRLEREVGLRGLTNFRFLPYQPREQLADCLGTADVHLVCLRPELEGLIVPSKFYGILAMGRPCIFVGDVAGELGSVVRSHDVGFSVAGGDSTTLVGCIRILRDDSARRVLLGERSRALFDSHYTLARAVQEWSEVLRSTSANGQAANVLPEHCRNPGWVSDTSVTGRSLCAEASQPIVDSCHAPPSSS